MDISFLNPQGHRMRILLSNTGIGSMNVFEALHTYMQRSVGSLPERGSLSADGEGLNFHLPWNYSEWLVKAQGYMVVHPFSSEALRLLWCARSPCAGRRNQSPVQNANAI